MSNRDDFSEPIKREIASWSNWHCMICHQPVSKRGLPRIAHIIPASKGGPRSEFYDEYDAAFRKSNKNGLLLCPKHHEYVDNVENNDYGVEDLFALNNRFRKNHELQSLINDELFSEYRHDDTIQAVNNLLEYLEISEDNFSAEIRENYKNTISNKIDLEDKLEINNLSNYASRKIKVFVEYEAFRFYTALTDTNEEIGNQYLLTAIKILYLKLRNLKSEQDKYDRMLKILKVCCKDLSINEVDLLNYYFYICEVFKK